MGPLLGVVAQASPEQAKEAVDGREREMNVDARPVAFMRCSSTFPVRFSPHPYLQSARHMDGSGERKPSNHEELMRPLSTDHPYTCVTCEAQIAGQAVFHVGLPFWCSGCVADGPCNCSYDEELVEPDQAAMWAASNPVAAPNEGPSRIDRVSVRPAQSRLVPALSIDEPVVCSA